MYVPNNLTLQSGNILIAMASIYISPITRARIFRCEKL